MSTDPTQFVTLGMVPELAKAVAETIDDSSVAPVLSVNGKTGAVTLSASDVGIATATTSSAGIVQIGTGLGLNGATVYLTTPGTKNPAGGGIIQQNAIANIAAAPSQNDFNGLLAALRAAGVLKSS